MAVFGELDKATRRFLRLSKDEGSGSAQASFEKRGPATREGINLKPGALLVREWEGKLERVMVLEEGFAWNGKTYGSLSQIAKAMTGTSWNGHRFFGPRQRKEAAKGHKPAGRKQHENGAAVVRVDQGRPRSNRPPRSGLSPRQLEEAEAEPQAHEAQRAKVAVDAP